jgi:hypothetical protein
MNVLVKAFIASLVGASVVVVAALVLGACSFSLPAADVQAAVVGGETVLCDELSCTVGLIPIAGADMSASILATCEDAFNAIDHKLFGDGGVLAANDAGLVVLAKARTPRLVRRDATGRIRCVSRSADKDADCASLLAGKAVAR